MTEVRDVKDTQSALTRDLESMYQAPISTEMGRWAKFKESFRRQEQDIDDMAGLDDIERANRGVANGSPLVRDLKNRHLQMISIGGSVGTGLLIGSGSSLRTGSCVDYSLGSRWYHGFLHDSRIGRIVCGVSCEWSLLQLCYSVCRFTVGICRGLELCHNVAYSSSSRVGGRGDVDTVLEHRY